LKERNRQRHGQGADGIDVEIDMNGIIDGANPNEIRCRLIVTIRIVFPIDRSGLDLNIKVSRKTVLDRKL
jgi:hypothetical protein